MSRQTSWAHLVAIDDDAALRALYRDLFARVGFDVTVTSPPVTVIDVRSVQPALMLLGWPYPWREPPALLRSMQRAPDLGSLPTIVSTNGPERAVACLPQDPRTRVVARPCVVEQILDCAGLLLAQARGLPRASLGLAWEYQGRTRYHRRMPRIPGPDES